MSISRRALARPLALALALPWLRPGSAGAGSAQARRRAGRRRGAARRTPGDPDVAQPHHVAALPHQIERDVEVCGFMGGRQRRY